MRATFVSTCCVAACSSHITPVKFYFSISKTWELATCYGTLSVNAKREEMMPVLPTEQNRVSKCQTSKTESANAKREEMMPTADCRVPRGDGDGLTVGASRR
ncbi:hypothetical protein CISIN_1g034195mg [Citrus sinensis]|uniref:Uncharacterized protein n=1 Tax=Citrus sinensis TaxID=2711 RepID=A0A067DRC8_CITSI|nr:hypothetical protein CISIN_1g034195mg [Citrus sinensis]